jgi:hypothetical protein
MQDLEVVAEQFTGGFFLRSSLVHTTRQKVRLHRGLRRQGRQWQAPPRRAFAVDGRLKRRARGDPAPGAVLRRDVLAVRVVVALGGEVGRPRLKGAKPRRARQLAWVVVNPTRSKTSPPPRVQLEGSGCAVAEAPNSPGRTRLRGWGSAGGCGGSSPASRGSSPPCAPRAR